MPLSFWNVKHIYPSLQSPCGGCGQTKWVIPNINKTGVLNGYFNTNWGMAAARGNKWEALKVVNRGKSLSKTYGIRKRLAQELMQQEDILATLQCQIDNGDASESDCLKVRGRIVELWDRLANYVCWSYRQRLYREDHMLAWLLRQERPIPIIQMLRGPSGEKILGQLWVNLHLPEHLPAIYATPCGVGVTPIREYLEGLQMPRLMEAQSEELEVSLDDLVEALGVMASGKAPGPEGVPVEFYQTYPAVMLP
ncbi:hypothetical protein NDU88_001860 [Pleurodeles waltl]|uniref:Uncharacterized protein n=1 Tax=Pleurodeles waltl TaxID=8319 RepID=A0AAV7W0P4_PLEWA|nr:hypothetical protein NDU88_001860 [Pleurodeles waltl]